MLIFTKTPPMKTSLTLVCFAICLMPFFIKAQQVGFSGDVVVGQGLNSMKKTIPVHGGVSYGFTYTPKKSPVTFGYRNALNLYSTTTKNELPYYREDYVHEVANISNNHKISQHIIFTRIDINKKGAVSPFIEAGGGYARYKSEWTATDPYENNNNSCEGYMGHGSFYKSGTFIANASTGVNIKLNKLSGKNNCSGVWLTFAIDYSTGGKVNYLNSKLNNEQFYYEVGTPALTDQPRRSVSHTAASTMAAGASMENYYKQSSYKEKHELVQVRVGVTMVVGSCK